MAEFGGRCGTQCRECGSNHQHQHVQDDEDDSSNVPERNCFARFLLLVLSSSSSSSSSSSFWRGEGGRIVAAVADDGVGCTAGGCGGQGEGVAVAMGRGWRWRRIILMMKKEDGYGEMNDVRK